MLPAWRYRLVFFVLVLAFGFMFPLHFFLTLGFRRFRSRSWRCDRWGWGWFRGWSGRLSEHAGECQ